MKFPHGAIEARIVGRGARLLHPCVRLRGSPAGDSFADDTDRCGAAMFAVVAVDENRPRFWRGGLREFRDALRGNAVVAEWQVDVAQAVFLRRLHIRQCAVHADDRLHSRLRERGEGSVAPGCEPARMRAVTRKALWMPGSEIGFGFASSAAMTGKVSARSDPASAHTTPGKFAERVFIGRRD